MKRLSWPMMKGVDCLVYRAAVVTWMKKEWCVRPPVCCPLKTRKPFTHVCNTVDREIFVDDPYRRKLNMLNSIYAYTYI